MYITCKNQLHCATEATDDLIFCWGRKCDPIPMQWTVVITTSHQTRKKWEFCVTCWNPRCFNTREMHSYWDAGETGYYTHAAIVSIRGGAVYNIVCVQHCLVQHCLWRCFALSGMSQKIKKTSIQSRRMHEVPRLSSVHVVWWKRCCRLCIGEFTNGDASCSRMNASFAIFGLTGRICLLAWDSTRTVAAKCSSL